ncbi:MAG: hypothetical protein C3F11_01680 [Methylocystaceae bacterium]|nr:MAG: hypothetical protein C3F11_01680 [Methylocystaceae bacterium]
MAEPEATSFTRRTLLVASVGAAAPAPFRGVAPVVDTSRTEVADPATSVWTQWRTARDFADALCRKQQSLETRLMQLIRASRTIGEAADAETDQAGCEEDHRVRWAAADLAIGYSEAKKEEEQAADTAKELADALAATPALSIAGVAAKLHAILREGEWCENCPEFPWPQVRSALTDLIRIGRLDSFPEL